MFIFVNPPIIVPEVALTQFEFPPTIVPLSNATQFAFPPTIAAHATDDEILLFCPPIIIEFIPLFVCPGPITAPELPDIVPSTLISTEEDM